MLETPNSPGLSESNCYSINCPVPRYLPGLSVRRQSVSASDFKNEPLSEKADECYGEWLTYDEK